MFSSGDVRHDGMNPESRQMSRIRTLFHRSQEPLCFKSLSRRRNFRLTRQAMGCFVAFFFFFIAQTAAQQTPSFFEWVHRLPVSTRVLMTGAHPDDEESALLAYVSRAEFADCAYLSATRGEGGQNLIGPELFDALGIIRTEELLAARRYDRCAQFFTRAYDFGFSKDPQEAFAKWGREATLSDLVRVIRRYRPDIIISVWQGTKDDGHGHHQAIGLLTPEAFHAAGDPSRFSEQLNQGLHPWQARQLYILSRDSKAPHSFSIDAGQFSPEIGMSLTEVAALGRSQHQSQGQGTLRIKGPHVVHLKWQSGAENEDTSTPPSARTPRSSADTREGFLRRLRAPITSWNTFAGDELDRVPFLAADLLSIESLARAMADSSPEKSSAAAPRLIQGLRAVRSLRQKILASGLSPERQFNLEERLRSKEQDFAAALEAALGLSFEVKAERAAAVPGESLTITATMLNRASVPIELLSIEPVSRVGWKMEKISGEPASLGLNDNVQWKFSLALPAEAAPTEMYWLQIPRAEDRYNVANPAMIGRAESPPEISWVAHFRLKDDAEATPLHIERPAKFVSVDPRYGQNTETFKVVPALSVSMVPTQLLAPRKPVAQQRSVFVRIENETDGRIQGTVKLLLPRGWKSTPFETAFSASRRGERVSKKFNVQIPPDAPAGNAPLFAVATVGQKIYSSGFERLNYPHIHAQNFYRKAETIAHVLDLKVPPHLSVGYVMGTGDRVPEALEEMGMSVTMLDELALAVGKLSAFDAIVTGIRAYDVRRDLAQNNARLLEYVRNGGTLIVQYNSASFLFKPSLLNPVGGATDAASTDLAGSQPAEQLLAVADPDKQFAPFPMLRGALTDRVVDEAAPVKILAPQHAVFRFPNLISEKDFEGWVQERGLYFMRAWDSHYLPLLAAHDPGENDLPGGMLFARYGKGNYVYTGYAWFRQLPAGVSGAYRIVANLISLSRVAPSK